MDSPVPTPNAGPLKPLRDCRLYTFVDCAYLAGRDPCRLTQLLCAGGADLIQLRAKAEPVERIRRIAESLLEITRAAGVWLVINDHVEVAMGVGAPACHLGQEDFQERAGGATRHLTPPNRCPLAFGLSTHAPHQAVEAISSGAAYIAIGPVFRTPTKPAAIPVTLDYVRWAAAHVEVPWFAIGGLTLENVDSVLDAGARRICVVSAILQAEDVAAACRAFRDKLVN